MRIIPAIDVINGECVRLKQGDYNQKKTYSSDPVRQAQIFEEAGCKYLHLVDLDGARRKSPENLEILRQIVKETSLKVDFGGGIKTEDSLKKALDAGAEQVTVGSLSASDPTRVVTWIGKYGAEKIIIGADVKDEKIQTHGWQNSSGIMLDEFMNYYVREGGKYFVCTDIEKDGMLGGSSESLYTDLIKKYPDIHLIASGGISSIAELVNLQQMGVEGAIIGKSIYEGLITLKALQEFLEEMAD